MAELINSRLVNLHAGQAAVIGYCPNVKPRYHTRDITPQYHTGPAAGSRRYALPVPLRRLPSMTAMAAQKAGSAPTANICCGVHPEEKSVPASTGPTTEPMRPTPRAQPTPVERI